MKQIAVTVAALLLTTTAYAGGVAIYTGEILNNMTKMCIYERLGETYTITIRRTAICPRTIQV